MESRERVIDCACQFSAAGHLEVYCGCCGDRRNPVPRGTVEKRQVLGWECPCLDAWTGQRLPKLRRHRQESDCVTPAVVAIWRGLNPAPAAILSEQSQKRLSWMWLQFSQDPEAKRLSGRA